MQPGFSSLFKRGQYSRREGLFLEAGENGMASQGCNQIERFTAAVVAFGLRYDREFRRHFLERICGISRSSLDNFRIEIEPGHCSDLVLEDVKNKSNVFVVELKLHADLQNHQNPSLEEFWTSEKEGKVGYGLQIGKQYGEFKKLCYVTLQKHASWTSLNKATLNLMRRRLSCSHKEWSDLRKIDPDHESEIEKAIYDFLGTHGVNAFVERKMIMKMNNKEIPNGIHAYNLLKFTMESLGQKAPYELEVSLPGESSPWFGVHLPAKMFKKLATVIFAVSDSPISNSKHAGWLGYDKYPDLSKFEPTVWLFCESSSANKKIRRLLGANYKMCNPEDHQLRISPKNEPADDMAWFCSLIEKLGNYWD